jgi:hypothetical protein
MWWNDNLVQGHLIIQLIICTRYVPVRCNGTQNIQQNINTQQLQRNEQHLLSPTLISLKLFAIKYNVTLI